jgi:hypothetical protein
MLILFLNLLGIEGDWKADAANEPDESGGYEVYQRRSVESVLSAFRL